MNDPTTDMTSKVAVGLITETFKSSLRGLKEASVWFKSKSNERDFFGVAAKRYADKVEERYNSMRILGMEKPIPLRSIYTRINILEKITAHHRVTIQVLEEFFQRDQRSFGRTLQTIEGIEVVNKLQKFIVLGKPGAGKTTFLKYIALQSIDGNLKKARIPILIGLKDWSDSKLPLIDFVVKQFDICSFPNATAFVERMLSKGRCLLLLDGFDEVNTEVEDAIVQIRDFVDKFSKNQFILSCRIAAYNYCFEKFTEVEIADFGNWQIETFVNNWFGKGTLKAESFLRGMSGNKPIKELAIIPLLLTMLCLAFDETLDLASNRSELYKEALDALLKKWDASRSIKRQDIYKHLSPQRKVSMFSRIAKDTFEKDQYFLPQRVVEGHIANFIQNLLEARQETLDLDSEAVLKAVEAQHGLLVERAKGIYSFSHLTFQEYFTARYLVDNASKGTLEWLVDNHITIDKWREVFLLSTGMLEEADDFLLMMLAKMNALGNETLGSYLKQIQENIIRFYSPYSGLASRILVFYYILTVSPGNAEQELGSVLTIARSLDPTFEKAFYEKSRAEALDRAFHFDQAVPIAGALSHEESSALGVFLKVNRLIADCLSTDCYVSTDTRRRIYDSLLMVT